MVAEAATKTLSSEEQRGSFFRQSGWLMIATIAGGVCTYAVHFLGKAVGPEEYAVFGALLALATFIPAAPLQVVLAQQTALALATNRRGELAGMIRWFWLGTFVLWLVAAVLMLVFQAQILARWQIPHAASLWVTLPVLLFSCWFPLFCGVLQGQQNFLWFGWASMASAVGRIAVAALAVLALGAAATGMVTGVLVGLGVAVLLAVWQTQELWRGPALPFAWGGVLRQVVPLVLGTAAFQFLFTADTMYVKACFNGQLAGFYISAGTMARALMWVVGPLATVMFPRIVQSAVRSEKTNLLGTVLLGTAVLSVGGTLGLCLVGPRVVQFAYGPEWVATAAAVLPWYAGAMIPLTLGNALLNYLLARSAFKVVPVLCVLALGYAAGLSRFHDSLVTVLKVFGFFNLLFLFACAWFTWRLNSREQPGS